MLGLKSFHVSKRGYRKLELMVEYGLGIPYQFMAPLVFCEEIYWSPFIVYGPEQFAHCHWGPIFFSLCEGAFEWESCHAMLLTKWWISCLNLYSWLIITLNILKMLNDIPNHCLRNLEIFTEVFIYIYYLIIYRKTSGISRTKSQNLNPSCIPLQLSSLHPVKPVLSWEWRCSWSSADRRCSNYIWVINNFIAY